MECSRGGGSSRGQLGCVRQISSLGVTEIKKTLDGLLEGKM